MSVIYLKEFEAFKQLLKILDPTNSQILQLLFSLWEGAGESLREELPSFARLLCKIRPDRGSWCRQIDKFKEKFLHKYYNPIPF